MIRVEPVPPPAPPPHYPLPRASMLDAGAIAARMGADMAALRAEHGCATLRALVDLGWTMAQVHGYSDRARDTAVRLFPNPEAR